MSSNISLTVSFFEACTITKRLNLIYRMQELRMQECRNDGMQECWNDGMVEFRIQLMHSLFALFTFFVFLHS